jgi:NTP pyrophosphatase (non-canonical NTP hydrolase)
MFGMKTKRSSVPWKTRMIQWIGEISEQNGHKTPSSFNDRLMLTSGDRLLSDMMPAVNCISAAAESVRRKDKVGYQQSLQNAVYELIDMIKDADVLFSAFDDAVSLTGYQALDGKLMLVVTELTEMSQAARGGDKEAYNHEHADAEIRLNHIAYGLGTDVQQAVEEKMQINAGRPSKHGKHTSL